MDKTLKERIKSTSMYRTLSQRESEETALCEIDMAVSNFVYDSHNMTRMIDPDDCIYAMGLEPDDERYLMDTISLAQYYASLEETEMHEIVLDDKKVKLDEFDFSGIAMYSFNMNHDGICYEITSDRLYYTEHFENIDKFFEFMDFIDHDLKSRWEDPAYLKVGDNYYTYKEETKSVLKENLEKYFIEIALKKNGQQELTF